MNRFLNIMLIGILLPLVILAPGSGSGSGPAEDAAVAECRQKIDALKSLKEKVVGRIHTALAVRAELMVLGRKFADEISDSQRHNRYGSFEDAIRNPRVRHNLTLIEMISGYTGALDKKIEFFKEGLEQIGFVFRQAEDELRMIQALGTLETSDLMVRVERLLTAYQAEAEKELISPAAISHRSCDGIWQDIVALTR
ncbi:MAG: hypothetical protein WAL90_10460 [Desulfobacterales bacterium]